MLTGTCSLRRVLRKGSCRSCPLLLIVFPFSDAGFPVWAEPCLWIAATSINYATYDRRTAADVRSSLPVAALGDDLAAPALGILLFRQDLGAALEGVGAGAKLDAH